MLVKLNISDSSLLRYRNNEDNKYNGYGEVIKKAEKLFSSFWQQYALEHPNLQSYVIFQLKQPHNGGLSDKQESSNSLSIDLKINGQNVQ